MNRMLTRMMRAAMLDARAYEEVEADRSATGQALAIVVLISVSAGIGSLENNGWSGIGYITAASLLGWILWAWLTCLIGTRILPGAETESNIGELLRTLGFASSPGLLFAFAVIPPLTPYVFPICGVWILASTVVAVRQALDYEGAGGTARAVAVCAIGFPIYALIIAATLLILGPWPI